MLWAYGPNLLNSVRILALGEQRWETWFFCKSYPDKMAMATRHTGGLCTHEVHKSPQWVSESLTLWIWVQQDTLPDHARGRGCEAVPALVAAPTPCQLRWQ
jgi:hypothetical protein